MIMTKKNTAVRRFLISSSLFLAVLNTFSQTTFNESFVTTNGGALCDYATETPIQLTGTGFLWGGYSHATVSGWRGNVNISSSNSRLELYANTDSDDTISANYNSTCFYTVFDTNGTASASLALDLTQMAIDVAWAAPGQEIRWLIRDAHFEWYLSASTGVVSSTTYSVNPAALNWLKVDVGASDEMNELDADAKRAIADPSTLAAGSPDLSAVTGGGLYVETGDTDPVTQYNFILTEMRWTGTSVAVPQPPVPDVIPLMVDVTRRRSINGQLAIIRKDLFNVHAGASSFSAAQQQYLFEDLDVNAGRSFGVIWKMNQIKEDTSRPDYWSLSLMNSQIATASNNWVKAGSPAHDNTTDQITTSHTTAHFPTAAEIASAPPNGFRTWNQEANAEFVSKYIQMFYPRMTWYEFSNEINGEAGTLGTTWSNICVMAKKAADRVHADNLGTKFVGFGGKWPAFERNGFGIWERDWVEFIDIAGASMDAYSVHLYSRMGPNAEAVMDMINNYSKIAIGETRPLMITEFGHLPDMTGTLEEKMWENIRGQNAFFFQFLERGGLMGRSIPFNTASATTWASAMLVDSGGTYVWSDMIRLYEFWKDFRGERLEVSSGDPDVLVHALQNGSTVRFVFYNTLDSSADVGLDYLTGDASITSAEILRLYWNGSNAALSTNSFNVSTTANLTLGGYEAVMLTLNLSGVPTGQKENEKQTYFGDTMVQPISAGVANTVQINGLDLTKNMLKARLRLSAGNISSWLPASILVNGSPVSMPSDQMGSASDELQALEVSVPTGLLLSNNVISVTYSSTGGHLAGAVLDVTYGDPLQRDSDGDGLSDDFELRYGDGPESINPNEDSQGDGLNALSEFAMGLNPLEDNLANRPVFGVAEFGGSDYLSVTYTKAGEAVPFVDLLVLTSTNLVSGAGWQTNQTTVVNSLPLSNNVTSLTERANLSVKDSDAGFIKIEVKAK